VFGGPWEGGVSECETLAESGAIYVDACALVKIDLEEDSQSSLVRCLIYMSRIPVYCSLIGLGEFVGVAGKRTTHARIGSAGYLYKCRQLMMDLEVGKLRRVEPADDRFAFIQEAEDLLSRHASLGGGDLWHMMATRQLAKEHSPTTLFSFDADLVKVANREGLRAVYGGRVNREAMIRELTARGKWVPA
jgi:hypothetical protein